MGYYLRFLTESDDVSLGILHEALRATDERYEIRIADAPRGDGTLHFDGALYAEIEIGRAGQSLFDEEKDELVGSIGDRDDEPARRVLAHLHAAKLSVVVRVLWQGRETEATLARIDALWTWLFEHRDGLLQADGEGYYDREELVLAAD